ncbi:MAG: diaminopimelate decarboxylase [Planctomycetota bacterium]|jgi:diaminopimelate decarboxylase|nr:diaminopimelate decarboxylase [Planctomycetota bacterium]
MSTAPLDLAQRFGTPLYVYDLALVRRQARALRAALPYEPLQLLYAIKANPCPAVVKVLIDEGFGIDAVSPGEVAMALRCGCPAERVLYTENNATDDDLQAALEVGVLVTCGSLDRLRRLGELGGREAAVRINPDVGAAEHAHTLTAGPLTKFGIHHSQTAAIASIEADTGIRVIGAHMHIGSNVLEADKFVAAMEVILGVAKELKHLRFIDFGGGLGVPYREDQAALDLSTLGAQAESLMRSFCAGYGRKLELRLEPGRFLVAESGQLLTSVAAVKTNPDGRCFVGTDTGFNHLIRPCMYGSYHPIANLSSTAAPKVVDVVGNVCESGDVFARDRAIAEPKLGDVLAIGFAGAYGMSMASTYNLRPLPAEVVVDGDTVAVARQRKTTDDLIAQWEW